MKKNKTLQMHYGKEKGEKMNELLKLNIQRFANSDGKIVISTELDTKNFENFSYFDILCSL